MKDNSRRDFIKLSALAGGAALTSSVNSTHTQSQTAKGKRFKWKMCTTWSPKLPILQDSAELFAKMVKQATGGRLSIKVFAGGELIPPLETFDSVSSGAVDLGAGASFYWQGKMQASPFFCAIPFGMNPQMQNSWLSSGGGLELWRELYAPHKVVPFAFGNTGAQMAGWFKKEINSFSDIKGLKIRMPGLGGKVMAEAGANVVLMPGGELYTALERGTIDATEWVNPFHDERLGLHKAAKNYYYPGWQEPGATLELIINQDKWNALPTDLQKIVEACISYFNHWVLERSEMENGPALQRMTEKHGVKLRKLPDEVLAKLKEASQDVIQTIIKKDPNSKKIYQSYESFMKKLSHWGDVSSRSYYSSIHKK